MPGYTSKAVLSKPRVTPICGGCIASYLYGIESRSSDKTQTLRRKATAAAAAAAVALHAQKLPDAAIIPFRNSSAVHT